MSDVCIGWAHIPQLHSYLLTQENPGVPIAPLKPRLHTGFVTSQPWHGKILSSSVVLSLPLLSFYPAAPQPESFLIFLQPLSLFTWRHNLLPPFSAPLRPSSFPAPHRKWHRRRYPPLMHLVSLVRPSRQSCFDLSKTCVTSSSWWPPWFSYACVCLPAFWWASLLPAQLRTQHKPRCRGERWLLTTGTLGSVLVRVGKTSSWVSQETQRSKIRL